MNSVGPGGRYGLIREISCQFSIVGLSTAGDSYLDYTKTNGSVEYKTNNISENKYTMNSSGPWIRYVLRMCFPYQISIGEFSTAGVSYFDYIPTRYLVWCIHYNW